MQGWVAELLALFFAGVYVALGEVSESDTYALCEGDAVGGRHFVLDDAGEGGGEGGLRELIGPCRVF